MGIFKICCPCFEYRNKEMSCENRKWFDYVKQFKVDNPRIQEALMDGTQDFNHDTCGTNTSITNTTSILYLSNGADTTDELSSKEEVDKEKRRLTTSMRLMVP